MYPFTDDDRRHMARALELARSVAGRTRPNPHVGCVIVRAGRVIGEGATQPAGKPHAEPTALAACTEDPRGATAYVTMEPCNHHGRTPPCSEALVAAGIARVVIAQRDPNALARGGVERLLAAGIVVECGLMEAEALVLNAAFNTFHMLGRPVVTLKWAMSADGCTSCDGGHAAWITGGPARARAHAMRAAHDAVMVGIGTAMQDGARLSARGVELPPGPPLKRVIVDSTLRLPPEHPFVQDTQGERIVACRADAPGEREEALVRAGVRVWRIEPASHGQDAHATLHKSVDLQALMRHLHREGVQSVMVEGGRTLAGRLLEAGFADRVAAFVAPNLVGAANAPLGALVMETPVRDMAKSLRLHHAGWETVGNECLMQGWIATHLHGRAKE